MSKAKETIDADKKQRAAEVIKKAPYARLLGIELTDIKPGEAVLKMKMRDELRQPYGVLHGGATASLIDTAMAFAIIASTGEDEKATTVNLTVHYLRPVTEGEIVCTAKMVRTGKRILTVSAEVRGEQGKLIATALSTYTKI